MRLSTTTKTLVLTTVFFATPLLALAAPIPFFGPLIPQAGNQASCPANWGMVLIVLNNVIAFAITMAIVFVAPIMLAYAGFILVANPFNPGAKEQAKKMILNVVVGIVLALASWLIVNAIMAVFYHPPSDTRTRWGAWQELVTSGDSPECIELASSLNPVEPGAGGVTSSGGDDVGDDVGDDEIPSDIPPEEAAVIARLNAAGVNINKDPCDPYNVAGSCTNVGGLKSWVVDQVINIKGICNCDVMVTGGSEAGHAAGQYSHAAGYKVDLRPTSAIESLFYDNLERAGSRGRDPRYKDTCGNEYVRESNHWDITVFSGACNI